MSTKKPTVNLEIGPTGKVTFEVSGLPGKGCEELEAALLTVLTGKIETRENTPEYYEGVGLFQKMKAVLGKS